MYKISQDDAKILRLVMEQLRDAKIYARLQAVALRGEGFTSAQIAAITGYNSKYVSQLCKTYVLQGLEILKADGRKGGNNQLMSDDEAALFLEQFESLAVKGQVITVEDIAKAYDEATGKERKSLSGVYYFLHNYDWRKIVPKGQHPGKASDETVKASKKLTLSSTK